MTGNCFECMFSRLDTLGTFKCVSGNKIRAAGGNRYILHAIEEHCHEFKQSKNKCCKLCKNQVKSECHEKDCKSENFVFFEPYSDIKQKWYMFYEKKKVKENELKMVKCIECKHSYFDKNIKRFRCLDKEKDHLHLIKTYKLTGLYENRRCLGYDYEHKNPNKLDKKTCVERKEKTCKTCEYWAGQEHNTEPKCPPGKPYCGDSSNYCKWKEYIPKEKWSIPQEKWKMKIDVKNGVETYTKVKNEANCLKCSHSFVGSKKHLRCRRKEEPKSTSEYGIIAVSRMCNDFKKTKRKCNLCAFRGHCPKGNPCCSTIGTESWKFKPHKSIEGRYKTSFPDWDPVALEIKYSKDKLKVEKLIHEKAARGALKILRTPVWTREHPNPSTLISGSCHNAINPLIQKQMKKDVEKANKSYVNVMWGKSDSYDQCIKNRKQKCGVKVKMPKPKTTEEKIKEVDKLIQKQIEDRKLKVKTSLPKGITKFPKDFYKENLVFNKNEKKIIKRLEKLTQGYNKLYNNTGGKWFYKCGISTYTLLTKIKPKEKWEEIETVLLKISVEFKDYLGEKGRKHLENKQKELKKYTEYTETKEPNIRICKNCGFKNAKKARYCADCGTFMYLNKATRSKPSQYFVD